MSEIQLIQPRRVRNPDTGAIEEVLEHPIAECMGRKDRVTFIQNGHAFAPNHEYLGEISDDGALIPVDKKKAAAAAQAQAEATAKAQAEAEAQAAAEAEEAAQAQAAAEAEAGLAAAAEAEANKSKQKGADSKEGASE